MRKHLQTRPVSFGMNRGVVRTNQPTPDLAVLQIIQAPRVHVSPNRLSSLLAAIAAHQVCIRPNAILPSLINIHT